jgi:hypothetical protein
MKGSNNSRFLKVVGIVNSSNGGKKVKRFAERVAAMITTSELLAPYGLGFYYAEEFFDRIFCGNLYYFAG